MQAYVSPEEELGMIVRRYRVLAGMAKREDLALKTGHPVHKIRSLEKGKPKVFRPEEVRLVAGKLHLNDEAIMYVDHLIQRIFGVPTSAESARVENPLTHASRVPPRLPYPRARATQ